jgi:hypothetical protein
LLRGRAAYVVKVEGRVDDTRYLQEMGHATTIVAAQILKTDEYEAADQGYGNGLGDPKTI